MYDVGGDELKIELVTNTEKDWQKRDDRDVDGELKINVGDGRNIGDEMKKGLFGYE